PELTYEGIERFRLEIEVAHIGNLPADPRIVADGGARVIQHGRIEVGRDQSGIGRERLQETPRHDAGAAGGLEDVLGIGLPESLGQILRVGLEDDGSQVTVVVLRDGCCELCVSSRCGLRHVYFSPWYIFSMRSRYRSETTFRFSSIFWLRDPFSTLRSFGISSKCLMVS